jgi:hypothetical protein
MYCTVARFRRDQNQGAATLVNFNCPVIGCVGVSPSVTHASPVLCPPIGALAGRAGLQQAGETASTVLELHVYTYRTQSIFQVHLLLPTTK